MTSETQPAAESEQRTSRNWWHRLRHANCSVCGAEFRKGQGSGVSRRTICSEACWAEAWADFMNPPRRYLPERQSPVPDARKSGGMVHHSRPGRT